jgi:hypothetical protein
MADGPVPESSPVLLIGAEVLPGKISVKVAPAAQRGRTTLMVIFHGERLPGDRRTARLSVRARRCGSVAACAACLRVRGVGAAVAPAAGGLPPIGRGPAAAPELPSSPATPGS